MRVYCHGELTTMRVWGQHWVCDSCGKKLWRYMRMPKAPPKRHEVALAYVFPGSGGFRYTLRDHDNRVIYDSDRSFQSRYTARNEIKKRWPEARVSFEYK